MAVKLQNSAWRGLGCIAALLWVAIAGTAWAAESEESAVLEAQSQRFRAQVAQDFAAIERLLADDVTYTHSSGLRQSKSEVMASLRSGSTVYRRVEVLSRNVKVNGPVALITGNLGVSLSIRGSTSDAEAVFTEVQVYRDGRWQMLAWHTSTTRATPVTPPP